MNRSRGDTIIELMLAFSIFSLAAVSTIAIMNKGVAISQQSLEVSLVRAQMDGQAEIIRYLRDTNDPLWSSGPNNIINHVTTNIAPLSPATCPSVSDITSGGSTGNHGFFISKSGSILVINDSVASFADPTTYAKIDSDNKAYGLWVQIAKGDSGSSETAKNIVAYDVYIHACWSSLVSDNTPATLGTIVRIYDK